MSESASYVVMWLAVGGLVLSVWSHISALQGGTGPLGDSAWFLHIGIFIVWIPTVIAARRLTKGVPKAEQWKALLRGVPDWVRYAFYAVFAYAMINFLVFMNAGDPNQKPQGGPMPPSVLRGFSGHWIVFYGAAFLIMLSNIRLQWQASERAP